MSRIEIDFDWRRAFDYELADSKKGPVIRQRGSRLERYWPLRANENLYLAFAKLDGSPEQCLEFARRWGFLEALPGNGAEEDVDLWRHEIKFMQLWLGALAAGDVPGAKLATIGMRSRVRITSVDVVLSVDPPDAHRALVLKPGSLIDAMKLQLAQAAGGGSAIATCQQCGEWFEIGKEGKRTVAKFCSDRCRNRFNYERRAGK